MLIEILSLSRLKITLDTSDLEGLGVSDLKNAESIKKAVVPIIPLLDISEGFREEDCTVSVRCSDAGATVFITKKAEGGEKKESTVLSFESVKDLVSACRHLSAYPTVSSDLYVSSSYGKYIYYLTVTYLTDSSDHGMPLWLVSAFEFAIDDKFSMKGSFLYYLSEHCRLICRKNAVLVIANSQFK